MNKIKILFIAVGILTLSACNRWLDVNPSDELVDSELFSRAEGFRHSLNGIYGQMTSENLYGRNLSWGMNSALGQEYDNGKMSGDQYIAHDFDQQHQMSRSIMENIWTTAYNSIANCNKLLQDIEKLPDTDFAEGRSERNMIIGEALGMRALLHFELLRLYAPSPKQGMEIRAIPYVKHYPAKANPVQTVKQVVEQITTDLLAAQSLVAENDTLTNVRIMSGGLYTLMAGFGFIPPGGRFFTHRMHRMNYVAIHGLLARVHLYAGNRDQAKQHAKYVYDNYGPDGRLKWWNFTPEMNTFGDGRFHKLANDILLAFYNVDLIADNQLKGISNYRLTPDVNRWFSASERDFRATLIRHIPSTSPIQNGDVNDKWAESKVANAVEALHQNFIIPVLRMSEVYYIYSECLFLDGETTEALHVLNRVRNSRGMLSVFSQTAESAYYQELLNEYHREFLSEGQTVFAYKRLVRPLLRGTQLIPMDQRFVLAIPDREQIF